MKTKPFKQLHWLFTLLLFLSGNTFIHGADYHELTANRYADLLPMQAQIPQLYFGEEAPVQLPDGRLVHPSAVPKVLLPDRNFTVKATPAEVQNNSNSSFQTLDPCSIDNAAFQAGERITYKLFYNWNFVWIAAGEVTFIVYDIGNEYHISVRGRTYSSYEWFYKVRDHYESYVDKQTLLPRMHIKDVHQGNYRRYDRTTFDQGSSRAVSMRGVTRDSLTRKNISFEGCMHDLISIVYYTRNLDVSQLGIGDEVPITILMDQEIYPLKIKYLGADDNVKVKGAGRYRTQIFSPQLIAGDVFKEGDEMKIFVGDDANRIPVMITSPVTVGEVKAVILSTRNLRHPFTARR
ncbi:MAG: DUF3108 domain-containing protein [Bacteroidota bacterium]